LAAALDIEVLVHQGQRQPLRRDVNAYNVALLEAAESRVAPQAVLDRSAVRERTLEVLDRSGCCFVQGDRAYSERNQLR